MPKSTVVQPTLLARLATVSVLEAGGKPSTWFPPGTRRAVDTSDNSFPWFSFSEGYSNLKSVDQLFFFSFLFLIQKTILICVNFRKERLGFRTWVWSCTRADTHGKWKLHYELKTLNVTELVTQMRSIRWIKIVASKITDLGGGGPFQKHCGSVLLI